MVITPRSDFPWMYLTITVVHTLSLIEVIVCRDFIFWVKSRDLIFTGWIWNEWRLRTVPIPKGFGFGEYFLHYFCCQWRWSILMSVIGHYNMVFECFCNQDESIQHLFIECPLELAYCSYVFQYYSPKNITNLFDNWLAGVAQNGKVQI
jgi:hypothetical protein